MEPERQFVTLGDTGRYRRENDYCRLSSNQYLDLAAAIAPVVTAAPYPCDAFLMQRKYGIPTLLFGPCGGGAHNPDDFVETCPLLQTAEVLLTTALEWCGQAGDRTASARSEPAIERAAQRRKIIKRSPKAVIK